MRQHALFFAFVAVITIGCRGAYPQEHKQGFVPLDGIRITASEGQAASLKQVLKDFSERENLSAQSREFQKRGRLVFNMTLGVGNETFFHIDNFRDSDSFELNVYSHENRKVWGPIWDRLTDAITKSVGVARVKKKFKNE